MYSDDKIVAVIPARGGSKGVPGKNIRLLGGKPLIAHTILAAKKSKFIDSVVVSTDSLEIAEIARRYGAQVPFIRPSELARDSSKTIDALLHACDTLSDMGRRYDVLVTLQPTSPLRASSEIDKAIDVFYHHACMGVASVCRVADNPLLIRHLDDFGVAHPILSLSSTVRRQDLPEFWRVNGAIYINKIQGLSSETSLNDNPIAFKMPRHKSIDIDSIEDLRQAEIILSDLEADS